MTLRFGEVEAREQGKRSHQNFQTNKKCLKIHENARIPEKPVGKVPLGLWLRLPISVQHEGLFNYLFVNHSNITNAECRQQCLSKGWAIVSPIDAPAIRELFQNDQVKESEKIEDGFLTSPDPLEQYVFQTSIDYDFIELKWTYLEFGVFKRKRVTTFNMPVNEPSL